MAGQRLGQVGERLAARHLQAAGYRVVARNWRWARGAVRGEIDLVAWDGDVLVVCEVKTRRGSRAGGPFAAVTARKAQQLRRLAAAYLAEVDGHVREVRFDVVGVCWPDGGGRARITHLKGAL